MEATDQTPANTPGTGEAAAIYPFRPLQNAVWWIQAVSFAAAAAASVLVYGFNQPLLSKTVLEAAEIAAVAAFVLERLTRLLPVTVAARELRRFWLDYAVIVAGAAIVAIDAAAYGHPVRCAGAIYLIVLAALMLVRYGLALYHSQMEMLRAGRSPAALLAMTFAAVILLGGFLLTLPTVSRPILAGEHPYQWREHVINCLFTATSATTLTGLTVYRTGHDFTLAGQVIIIILIQIGGIAVMTAGTVFATLLARRRDSTDPLIPRDALDEAAASEVGRTLRLVCLTMFAFEAIGTLMLYPMWRDADVETGGRWFWSVFHAVSAFCNAGFALHDDSLIPYRGCWRVYGAIMPLIVIGGLGLPILRELCLRGAARIRPAFSRRFPQRPELERPCLTSGSYSLHFKLTVSTTAILILGGTVLFWITETPAKWTKQYEVRMDRQVLVRNVPDRMSTMSAGERWWSALFLSVASRTGGFRTALTDEQSLSPATHHLLCLLMFVGGSPASAAGGIKTVTSAVLLLAIVSALRRRDRVAVFGRTIPAAIVNRAFIAASLLFGMVFVVTWLLCYLESHSLRELLFETVSASGNVGLSTGITPNLTKAGRLLIVLCMFAGRVGPLALVVMMAARTRTPGGDRPEESPMLG